MIGPVLYQELLLGSRRGKQQIIRWSYAAWLTVQLLWFYSALRINISLLTGAGESASGETARFGGHFLGLLIAQQMILIVLLTPAIVAGAIADEKATGTLQYLLTADLAASEIILGKLLGRLAQLTSLLLVGLPLMCFIGIFGGMNMVVLMGIAAISLLIMFALGGASLLASVWCRHTRDAVLAVYTIGGVIWVILSLAALLYPAPPGGTVTGWHWLIPLQAGGVPPFCDPWFILEPAWLRGDLFALGVRLSGLMLVCGGIGGLGLALATWRLRAAYICQLEGTNRKNHGPWWQAKRTAVHGNPVHWKERQVEGLAPIAALRAVPRRAAVVGVCLISIMSSSTILWAHLGSINLHELFELVARGEFAELATALSDVKPADAFLVQALAVMLLASLIVGIRCSGAVTGERERQTWEALLLTPLQARHLIRGKLWGIIGATYPYLRAYAVPAIILSLVGGLLSVAWTMVWLAVTILAMYFIGAAGLMCSVRAKSSWRSLLGTAGWGYALGFLCYLAMTPLLIWLAFILLMLLAALGALIGGIAGSKAFGGFPPYFWQAFVGASCLALAGLFFGMAKYFVYDAEKRVSEMERTRHWGEEYLFDTLPQRQRRIARPKKLPP